MNQPAERRRTPPAKVQSPLRQATDTGIFKIVVPTILGFALTFVNNSVKEQTATVSSLKDAVQELKRSQELDKVDLANRVAAIEKFIPAKSAERDHQMEAMNQQISDLTKSVADLKDSVLLLTYKVDPDRPHRK